MYRLKGLVDGRRVGPESGVWYVRRVIPAGLRSRFDNRTAFVQTTEETDHRKGTLEAERLWSAWGAEIEHARKLGAGPVADPAGIAAAIENWRRAECEVAAGLAASVEAVLDARRRERMRAGAEYGMAVIYQLPAKPLPPEEDTGPVHGGWLEWARAYFDQPRNHDADRGVGLPYGAGLLISRLQVAGRDPSGWTMVPGFDDAFDRATTAGGLVGIVLPRLREDARRTFAVAWLEVARHQEGERSRAASILAAFEADRLQPAGIVVQGRPERAYVAQEGDLTVAEVIEAFKVSVTDREAAKGGDGKRDPRKLLEKGYGHLFKALEALVGADKPIRAVTRTDVRDILRLFYMLPSNASKIYPEVPLHETAELAARDGRKTLAPNTVRTYMTSLKTIFDFALAEDWVDSNPVQGLVPAKNDETKRRAFTEAELSTVFGALESERNADSARWWVPAVLAYAGARANEIAQLHVADIRDADGVHYIDLSIFDPNTGTRLDRRRLKNDASERAIPIHSALVSAGFLDFVERRRASGEERLFPDLKQNSLGYYSHELSKWWGRHLDSVGLTEPSLCLHSLRHGFKDAGDSVELPEYILEALGGWGGGGSAMRKYGGRCSPARVKANAVHIEQIALGSFSLGAPPAA